MLLRTEHWTASKALYLNPRSALGCVSEDKSLYFSEPQFIHLGNGDETPTSQDICKYEMDYAGKNEWYIADA